MRLALAQSLQTERIEMHSEAGFFSMQIGSGCALEDTDRDRAAAVALGEGHDGSGNPLVHSDGSLALLPQMPLPDDSEEFETEEVFFSRVIFAIIILVFR